MAGLRGDEQEPLLQQPSASDRSEDSFKSVSTARSQIAVEAGNRVGQRSEDECIPETAVLGRTLGWSSAYILIISRVIGSGIFATPGAIVRSVGSVGITLVLWVAGAIAAWFGLMVTLEYGCMLPRSGGDKVYLEFTYRRPRFLVSVLIAVQSVMLGFTASNCIVFAEYVLFVLGRPNTPLEMKLIAAGLLTTIIIVHGCFLKTGILIQNVLGYIKIALVVFMVFAGLFTVLFHSDRSEASATGPIEVSAGNSWNSLWEGSVWNWGVISTALFKVFYSYAGLHNVNNVLNEVKDPVKTLRSAASTALLTACLLYS